MNGQRFTLIVIGKIDQQEAAADGFIFCDPVMAIFVDRLVINMDFDCGLFNGQTQYAFREAEAVRQDCLERELIPFIGDIEAEMIKGNILIGIFVDRDIPAIVKR